VLFSKIQATFRLWSAFVKLLRSTEQCKQKRAPADVIHSNIATSRPNRKIRPGHETYNYKMTNQRV